MSRFDKLVDRLRSRPTDFAWDDAAKLLERCGFELIKRKGKGRASHRRFLRPDGNYFHIAEPHPGHVLKMYQVDELLEVLREVGCIDEE